MRIEGSAACSRFIVRTSSMEGVEVSSTFPSFLYFRMRVLGVFVAFVFCVCAFVFMFIGIIYRVPLFSWLYGLLSRSFFPDFRIFVRFFVVFLIQMVLIRLLMFPEFVLWALPGLAGPVSHPPGGAPSGSPADAGPPNAPQSLRSFGVTSLHTLAFCSDFAQAATLGSLRYHRDYADWASSSLHARVFRWGDGHQRRPLRGSPLVAG